MNDFAGSIPLIVRRHDIRNYVALMTGVKNALERYELELGNKPGTDPITGKETVDIIDASGRRVAYIAETFGNQCWISINYLDGFPPKLQVMDALEESGVKTSI